MIGTTEADADPAGPDGANGNAPRTDRRKRGRRLLLGLLVAGLGLLGLDRLNRSRTFQLMGDLVARVPTDQRVVALTLDDGPSPRHTGAVLDLLSAHGVRATFFLTGAEVEKYPEGVRRILSLGHEVGNHSWSHQRMIFVTPSFVRDELDRTDQVLRDGGCTGTIHFRPPYGRKLLVLPRELARRGTTTIMWDIEPESTREIEHDTDLIVEDVLRRARPGSIILLHVMYDSREPTRRALPRILEGLKQRGYRFVTVSELLALRR